MATTKKTTKNKTSEKKPSKVKKLSKIGEWLNSGGPVGEITDMRAILK